MTYAVIENGGRQYKVSLGERLALDLMTKAKSDIKVGGQVRLDKVLMVGGEGGARLGAPFVSGASVAVKVVGEAAGEKVVVFKRKRRKNYRRTIGQRKMFTVVEVSSIDLQAAPGSKGEKPSVKASAKAKGKPQGSQRQKGKVKDGS